MSDTAFKPQDPQFREKASASFAAQPAMHLVGARLLRVDPGEVEIALPYSSAITQQHGFVHGGILGMTLDSACGYAALSLYPPDAGILTIEYKINFLAPGKGDRFRIVGRVRKHGRTITLAEADAIGVTGGQEKLVATLTATMMVIVGRDDVRN
jgi:uncharacterized protein (TIGR00369 family)